FGGGLRLVEEQQHPLDQVVNSADVGPACDWIGQPLVLSAFPEQTDELAKNVGNHEEGFDSVPRRNQGLEAAGGGWELGEDAACEVGFAAARFAMDYPGHLVEVAGAFATEVQFILERFETTAQFLFAAGEEALNEARIGRWFGLKERRIAGELGQRFP